jgi:hypothetical protein
MVGIHPRKGRDVAEIARVIVLVSGASMSRTVSLTVS